MILLLKIGQDCIIEFLIGSIIDYHAITRILLTVISTYLLTIMLNLVFFIA